jgi:exosortase/archaeosortase family protein
MGAAPLWLDVLVFGSLGLLGIGFFWKSIERHLFCLAGFAGVGVFWGIRSAIFVAEGADAVNISFTGLAMPFFVYLGWHEWRSYKGEPELPALKWATGATFLGGMLYFSVDRIELVASALIQVVAHQSLWLMNAFGYGAGWSVGPSGWSDIDTALGPIPPELGAPIEGSGVVIILGCTSFEAIVIFLGAIFAAQMRKDPWADYAKVDEAKVAKLRAMTPQRRQWLGLLYTVPVIWVLNLVRNGSVIYLYNSRSLDGVAASFGMSGFDFAHALLGKGLSFVALIAIAFVLFRTCPEILDNVNGLIDLPRRGKKGKGGSSARGSGAGSEAPKGADEGVGPAEPSPVTDG